MDAALGTLKRVAADAFVPSGPGSHAETAESAMRRFRAIDAPIDKYLYLRDLHDTDSRLYYTLLVEQIEEVLPYVYTPTVGEACQRYHQLPLRPHGLYISLEDKGRVKQVLDSWPQPDVRVVVLTDGERLLGLGDVGANGMGICEGKISLYTAAAGVDPSVCLPACLDVGTNNEALLQDPQYRGLRRRRAESQEYDELVAELVAALKARQPPVLLQWEDFGNTNAFRLLSQYRGQICCFNDDIQGTAAITLAALLAAARLRGQGLQELKVLFLGAGEAGIGIGHLMAQYLNTRCGMEVAEARQRCLYLDSHGLVCSSRQDLTDFKKPFAHPLPHQPDLHAAIKAFQPDVIVGVSSQHGAFDQAALELMLQYTEQPIVMPLSNPTSKSECTYEEAFRCTGGKVIFASGSPFAPLTDASGASHQPAQANNVYIFPAMGMAAVMACCSRLTDDLFLVAAEELAGMAGQEEMRAGRLFPPFSGIRQVSAQLAAKLAAAMVRLGLGKEPSSFDGDWAHYMHSSMWPGAGMS